MAPPGYVGAKIVDSDRLENPRTRVLQQQAD
jgi:hypothetical protein